MQPPITQIIRSGLVEGHHYGAAVRLGARGEVTWSHGVVNAPVLPRSCNKPLQVLGMVRAGLDLPPDLLALASASHSGQPFHLDGVRRILALARLEESALQNPADFPLDETERDALIRRGVGKAPVFMNCSGKHAAMLVTCALNGWDTTGYLDPTHPLQRALVATFEELTGEQALTAVDGCGAPLWSTSLVGLARAFGRIARGVDGQGQEDAHVLRVAQALRSHPEFVSGTHRDELILTRAVPGAIAKLGAEACYALSLADGRSFAVKIDDGGDRARPVVMSALLLAAGVDAEPGVDGEALRRIGRAEITGGVDVVGVVQPLV